MFVSYIVSIIFVSYLCLSYSCLPGCLSYKLRLVALYDGLPNVTWIDTMPSPPTLTRCLLPRTLTLPEMVKLGVGAGGGSSGVARGGLQARLGVGGDGAQVERVNVEKPMA